MSQTLQRIDDCIAKLSGPFPNPAIVKEIVRETRNLLEELIEKISDQETRLLNLEELADEETD